MGGLVIIKAATKRESRDAGLMIARYGDYIAAMRFEECLAGSLEEEAGDPIAHYLAAQGAVWVAYLGGIPVGCVAMEKQAEHIAEIRRLYVDERARGRGLGAKLVQTAVEEARKLGYSSVRLDTFRSVDYASRIYLALGFTEIAPYSSLPEDKIIFLEQVL